LELRHEYKQIINYLDVITLKNKLSFLMEHDEHAGDDGVYIIKSLYFDNYLDKALCEKQDGVNKREKFRIRYYGNDTSFIRLEKKSKINGLCNKQSAPLTASECQKIIDGDTEFLLESSHNLLREFYAKMRYQVLRPKCIVKYARESFVYLQGNVRVTIDSQISGSYNVREFLNPDLQYLKLFDNTVLEVKYDEYLPQIIKNAVQLKSRKASAFSKYAAARF